MQVSHEPRELMGFAHHVSLDCTEGQQGLGHHGLYHLLLFLDLPWHFFRITPACPCVFHLASSKFPIVNLLFKGYTIRRSEWEMGKES